eukprot:scaffold316784_cov21-Tisochrysis_lutea.AAC.2
MAMTCRCKLHEPRHGHQRGGAPHVCVCLCCKRTLDCRIASVVLRHNNEAPVKCIRIGQSN